MIDLPIDIEAKGRPDHRNVVIDPDERLMDAFLNSVLSRLADTRGKLGKLLALFRGYCTLFHLEIDGKTCLSRIAALI